MSTQEKRLYQDINVKSNKKPDYGIGSKTYKGFSTTDPDQNGFNLYDFSLIKQDIINHFHIRQGELLSNPNFGTIIWDAIFEPMTPSMEEAIAENVKRIVNSDPRVTANSVIIDTYESGIIIDCDLTYLPYNISEKMRLKFDENSGMN